MKRMIGFRTLLLAVLLLAVGMPVRAVGMDNSIYATLLDAHLADGLVDYRSMKQDEKRLDAYLEILSGISPQSLGRDEQFAFYVNAYNAWTIKLILMNYPGIESIKDIGGWFSSPWKKEFVRIEGREVTLDYIEHEVLRPRFGDPRVHFAVNCASIGCPPLYPEPFVGGSLDKQLNDATVSFLNDPTYNRLEGNTLHVSKIFDWFGGDFGGEDKIVDFFIKYAKPDLRLRLQEHRQDIEIQYLDYDWSLNAQHN